MKDWKKVFKIEAVFALSIFTPSLFLSSNLYKRRVFEKALTAGKIFYLFCSIIFCGTGMKRTDSSFFQTYLENFTIFKILFAY